MWNEAKTCEKFMLPNYFAKRSENRAKRSAFRFQFARSEKKLSEKGAPYLQSESVPESEQKSCRPESGKILWDPQHWLPVLVPVLYSYVHTPLMPELQLPATLPNMHGIVNTQIYLNKTKQTRTRPRRSLPMLHLPLHLMEKFKKFPDFRRTGTGTL
jgi:hypothetical protein